METGPDRASLGRVALWAMGDGWWVVGDGGWVWIRGSGGRRAEGGGGDRSGKKRRKQMGGC